MRDEASSVSNRNRYLVQINSKLHVMSPGAHYAMAVETLYYYNDCTNKPALVPKQSKYPPNHLQPSFIKKLKF